MSVKGIRTYARNRMAALGFTEWTDGFNFENVPQTLLSTRYILRLNDSSGGKVSNDNQEISFPLVVESAIKPTGNPKSLIEQGFDRADSIIDTFMVANQRLSQTDFRNIVHSSTSVVPLDGDSNDNGVRVLVGFNFLVIIDTT